MAIHKGDRFRITRDWRGVGAATFADGHDEELRCVIPDGSVLVSLIDVDVSATGFLCTLESEEVIEQIVPAEQREGAGFTGCRFMFFIGDIGALLQAL